MTLLLFYSLALLFASVLCSQLPFFFNPSANTHINYSGVHTRNHLHKMCVWSRFGFVSSYHALLIWEVKASISAWLFTQCNTRWALDQQVLVLNACNSCLCVCVCLCSWYQCVAHICMCYTYMHVYSALMSLPVSPCSPQGQTLWVQRSQARSGAWAGHPAAAHRGATVLLLLPPSDQRTAWVLQFQPQHKTLVSGFPQSSPATAEAPFVPTLNKT